MRSNRERDIMPSLCKGGCRTKRGGRIVKVRTTRVKQPFRQARSSPATVSAAQGERRLSHGFCPQWQKPQFAAHARHTVAMRIMRGSPPCTGEARKSTCLVPAREAREVRRTQASTSGADHRLPDAFKAFLAGERVRKERPDLGIHLRAGVREGALEARDAHHGALRHHLGDVRTGTVL